jgi:hypothetical protein
MKFFDKVARFKRNFRAVSPKITRQEAEQKIISWRNDLFMQDIAWKVNPGNNPNLTLQWLPFQIYTYNGPVKALKGDVWAKYETLDFKNEKIIVYGEPNYAPYMDDIRFQYVPEDNVVEPPTGTLIASSYPPADLLRIANEHTQVHFEYSLQNYARIDLPGYVHFDPPELIYFPVYKFVYMYGGHKYLIFVNGRNGFVVGDKHNSFIGYTALTYVVLSLLMYESVLVNPTDFDSIRSLIPIVDAMIAIGVGLGYKYYGVKHRDEEPYFEVE